MDKAVQPGGSAVLMCVFHALHAACTVPCRWGCTCNATPLSCSLTNGDILGSCRGQLSELWAPGRVQPLQGKKEHQQCLRRGWPASECRIEAPGPGGFDALPPGSLPMPGGVPNLCDSALSHTHPLYTVPPASGPNSTAKPTQPGPPRQGKQMKTSPWVAW